MSFFQDNLDEARTLIKRIRNNNGEFTEYDVRNAFQRMGFDISDEDNNVYLLMAFLLGALGNEPEDSDWLKIVK